MKVKDYELEEPDISKDISKERKEELIKYMMEKVKNKKNRTHIGHYEILEFGTNEFEWSFMTDWLYNNGITIIGTSGVMSGEIPNFDHRLRDGKKAELPPVLDNENIISLFKTMHGEDEKQAKHARDELIKHNLRLVNMVIQWPAIRKLDIPLDDKIGYAREGLIKAVDKFDYERGYKFSTYASIAIYRTIKSRWRDYEQPYSRNEGLLATISNIKMIEDQFLRETGNLPKDNEIAEILNLPIGRVKELKRKILENEGKISFEGIQDGKYDIERVIENFSDADSPKIEKRGHVLNGLGETLVPDEEAYILDGVYYDPEEDHYEGRALSDDHEEFSDLLIEEKAEFKNLQKEINSVLDTLKPREQIVLRLRYGLDGKKPLSLAEVGAILNRSGKTIRYYEAKALRKLRHPGRSNRLKGYLDLPDIVDIEGPRPEGNNIIDNEKKKGKENKESKESKENKASYELNIKNASLSELLNEFNKLQEKIILVRQQYSQEATNNEKREKILKQLQELDSKAKEINDEFDRRK